MTPIQQWLIDNGINYLCDDLVQLIQENPVTSIIGIMTMYQQWQIHGLNLDLADAREQIVAIGDTALAIEDATTVPEIEDGNADTVPAIEDASDDTDTTVPAIEDASSEQSDTKNTKKKQGQKRKTIDGNEPKYVINRENDKDDQDGNGSAPGEGGSTGSSSKVLEMVLEIEGSSNRGSSNKKARTENKKGKGKYRNKSNSNDDDADINDLLESLDNLDNNIDSADNYDSYVVAGLVSMAAISLVSADISPVIDSLSSYSGEVSSNLLDSMPDLLF